MNIKKYFLHLILITIGMISIIGCSDDKDDQPDSQNSIVGTWRLDFEDGYELMTFGEDGSYSLIEIDYVYGDWSEYGYYTLNGKTLTIYSNDGYVDVVIVKSVTNEKLIIEYSDEDGTYYEELTKVK